MTGGHGLWSVFLACALALALMTSLSNGALNTLLALWLLLAPLTLMAMLEPLRRGLSKRGGSLPFKTFSSLALLAVVTSLLLACLGAVLLLF